MAGRPLNLHLPLFCLCCCLSELSGVLLVLGKCFSGPDSLIGSSWPDIVVGVAGYSNFPATFLINHIFLQPYQLLTVVIKRCVVSCFCLATIQPRHQLKMDIIPQFVSPCKQSIVIILFLVFLRHTRRVSNFSRYQTHN